MNETFHLIAQNQGFYKVLSLKTFLNVCVHFHLIIRKERMALYLQTMFVGIIKVELLTMLCLVRNSFENKNPPNFVENLKCPAQNLHWQKFVPIQTAKRSKVGQLHNVLKESLVDLPIQFQTKIINAVQQCVLLLVFLIVVYYQILQVYLLAFLQVKFPYNT